jgi:hypothetical protein
MSKTPWAIRGLRFPDDFVVNIGVHLILTYVELVKPPVMHSCINCLLLYCCR